MRLILQVEHFIGRTRCRQSQGRVAARTLAQVHFKTATATPALVVPVSALIFRHQGMQVATVNGNVAHLTSVVIGEDDGQSVQIIHGLNANDRVIQDPPDSLIEGEQVRIVGETWRCALSWRASKLIFAASLAASIALGIFCRLQTSGPELQVA